VDQVKMRHPNLEGEITVPESAVPIHMASGWMRVEENTETATTTSKPRATAAAKDKE
jgi:hypothetical protein